MGKLSAASMMRVALSVTVWRSSPWTHEQPSRMSATSIRRPRCSRRWKRRLLKSSEQPAKTSGRPSPASISSSMRAWPLRLHHLASRSTSALRAGEQRQLVEVDVVHGAGALAEHDGGPHGRGAVSGGLLRDGRAVAGGGHAGAPAFVAPAGAAVAWTGTSVRPRISSIGTGLASAACVGQTRAQVPQPRQSSAS